MIYIQLYELRNNKHVQMIADRSVVILDARTSLDNQLSVAEYYMDKRKASGFELIRAQRFTDKGYKLASYFKPLQGS